MARVIDLKQLAIWSRPTAEAEAALQFWGDFWLL
jgi:hypothetical protein